jgi:TatD DNase family protein
VIDSHCHLAHIDAPPDETLAAARGAGVHTVIDIAMGLAECEASTARPGPCAVGIHPNELEEFEADPSGSMSRLAEIASRPGVVGIGETGLDFFRERSSEALQVAAFRAHIALAKELDKALVIHCRDAHDALIEVLDDAGAPSRTVMHCFSGDEAFAVLCATRGFFCSFAGNVTYKSNTELRRAATSLPTQLLLVETDAPFLTPEPHRGRPNAPALLPITANRLATERGTPLDELEKHLDDNTRRAFLL